MSGGSIGCCRQCARYLKDVLDGARMSKQSAKMAGVAVQRQIESVFHFNWHKSQSVPFSSIEIFARMRHWAVCREVWQISLDLAAGPAYVDVGVDVGVDADEDARAGECLAQPRSQ